MLNMERTFILGNSQAIQELGGIFKEVPELINEVEIHNWVVTLFLDNEVEKIVIEVGKNPLLSLEIGYHIRLSIEDLKGKSLVPILYLSTLSLNVIMSQTQIYSQILATKGVSFSEFDLQSNKAEILHLNGLNETEYITKFLKIIHIQPDETIGRHSLANIWGAYAMDKASNVNALPSDSEFKKKLYFKYLSAFNNTFLLKASPLKVQGYINIGNVDKIEAQDKRILLIDDEADKGWETVLKKVFKTNATDDFVVINEKAKDFDSLSETNKHTIETEIFDLYLIDLRLNGLEEEEILKTEDFSGMKVLQKIKTLNQGNQVVIFTASNKVWNLKALLDAGADGYYMKESPEYNFTRVISEQNYRDFKDNVTQCFSRGYLRDIWKLWINAKNENTNQDINFIAISNTALDMAWEQIRRSYLDFGFLTLFQCIESYANKLFYHDDVSDTYEMNGTTIIDCISDGQNEWVLTYNKDPKNGDYFSSGKEIQKSQQKPTTLYRASCLFHVNYQKGDAFLKDFGSLNKLRNDIAHHGAKGKTTKDDIEKILKIIKEIRIN